MTMLTKISPMEIEARKGSGLYVRAGDRVQAEALAGGEQSGRAINRPRAGRPRRRLDAHSGQGHDARGLTGTRSAEFTQIESR